MGAGVRTWAIALGAVAVLLAIPVGIFYYWMWSIERAFDRGRAGPPASETPEPNSTRKAFLAGRDLPDGTMLLLGSRAFGDGFAADGPEFRVVPDTAALRAAAPRVWVTNDDPAETRLMLLSILFLSPSAPNDYFATLLYPDGRAEDVFAFWPPAPAGETDATFDLAGLDALSLPAYPRLEAFNDPSAYAARVAEIQSDADLFFLDPPLPPDVDQTYPLRAQLRFPSLLLRTEELTPTRTDEEIRRVTALFAAAFGPPGKTYAPLNITLSPCWPPRIEVAATQAAVMVDDAPVTLDGFAALSLVASLSATAEVVERVEDMRARFAPPQQIDPGLDPAFAAAVTSAVSGADPADYRLYIDCWQPDIAAVMPEPNGQDLFYYQIVADTAP